MAKRKYTPQEQKPLAEVIGNRRSYYMGKISKAFDSVYRSGSFSYIECFERAVLDLTSRAMSGKLENVAAAEPAKPAEIAAAPEEKLQVERKPKAKEVDRRPRLTLYQYSKSRDSGMSLDEIKAKFRMSSPYQMGAFSKWYNERKQKKGKKGKK